MMMTAAMMKAETRPASRGSRVGASCTAVVSSPTFSGDGVALWLTPSLCASKCVAVVISFAAGVLLCGVLIVVVVVVVVEAVVVVVVVVVAAAVEGVFVDVMSSVAAVSLSACTGASDCDVLVISGFGGGVGRGAGAVSVLLVGAVSVLLVEPKVVEGVVI